MKTTVFYFSPTGGTEKLARCAAKAVKNAVLVDLLPFENRWKDYSFGKEDTIIVAVPVYYGRLPSAMQEFFVHLHGQETPALGLLAYGNNTADPAVEELRQKLLACGCVPSGLGAFVTQHSLMEAVGADRPDPADLAELKKFVDAWQTKAAKAPALAAQSRPLLRERIAPPMAPLPDESCTHCLRCANECPVKAINPIDAADTDSFRCLQCGHCVKVCPTGARRMRIPQLQEKLGVLQFMLMQERKKNRTQL